MKIKNILAAGAAAAVALSTMAVNSFAAITNANYPEDGNYVIDIVAEGYDVTEVYGVTFTLSGYDLSAGMGGGMGCNSVSTNWESHEWGNEGSDKEIILTEDGTITLKKDTPIFQESDASNPDDAYGQFWVQSWWGSDFAVDSVTVLDKDGNAIPAPAPADDAEESAPAEDTAPAEDAAPAEEAPAPAADSTTESAGTGNAAVASIAAVMAVAGAAVVASRKRK